MTLEPKQAPLRRRSSLDWKIHSGCLYGKSIRRKEYRHIEFLYSDFINHHSLILTFFQQNGFLKNILLVMPLEAAILPILPAEVNMLQYKHRLSILRSIDNLWYKHQLYYSLVL